MPAVSRQQTPSKGQQTRPQTRDVQAKFAEAWALAGRLPADKQEAFRSKLRAARAKALGAPPAVVGAIAQAKPVPKAAAAAKPAAPKKGEWEWDLALANVLDGVYTAVSDEVKKTAVTAKNVVIEAGKTVGTVSKEVGFGLWPLALAVLVAGYGYSQIVAPRRGV